MLHCKALNARHVLLSLPTSLASASFVGVAALARPLRDSGDALCDAMARGSQVCVCVCVCDLWKLEN